MYKSLFVISMIMVGSVITEKTSDFRSQQKQYKRVREAYSEKEASVKLLFSQKGIDFDQFEIYLRALKREKQLQLFARSSSSDQFKFMKSYRFCYLSGELGPKRRQGDLQVPEGFYHIDRFNPSSSYYLSLGINYPNDADRILGNSNNLGGDIFIHGDCVSIGCIPITDDMIKELYLITVEARTNGQSRIPVHIFPCKMNHLEMEALEALDSVQIAFWKNLKTGFDHFEQHNKLPKITVSNNGRYLFQ